MKHIAVVSPQVPFVRGGAEMLAESLVHAIRERVAGAAVELVTAPFKWYPHEAMLANLMAWRLLDLTEADGRPIDLLVATKFPSYAVRHPNKILWLVHQHRAYYDLEGTPFDEPVVGPAEAALRARVRDSDGDFVRECRARFAIARTVSDRLATFNGLAARPLFPPPRLADRIRPGDYGAEFLYVGRLNEWKRPDLLVRALAHVPGARAAILGAGSPDYEVRLRALVQECGVADRCELAGFVPDEAYLERLAGARAVFYAPVNEDYGFATLEAFLARKPVLTCTDAGEPARFVRDTGAGAVVEPTPAGVAAGLRDLLDARPAALAALAEPGRALAAGITWDTVVQELVVPFL